MSLAHTTIPITETETMLGTTLIMATWEGLEVRTAVITHLPGVIHRTEVSTQD